MVNGYNTKHLMVKRGRLGAYNIDQETTFGTRDIQPESEIKISGKKPFNGWGTLLVIGSIDGASNQQLAFTGENRMYIRCAYGTPNNYNTKDWAIVALTSDNVASATKLHTPRTIWGNTFNGTADVRGTLSEVANIWFSANNAYDIGSNSVASRRIYTHWLGAKSGQKLELGANNSGFGKGLCIDTNLNVGVGTNTPAQKLDVNGGVKSNGFYHNSHNSNDAVLLAGGGYQTLKGFIFSTEPYNYTDNRHYNLKFYKLNGICNHLVWVDGHVKGTITKKFAIDPAVFPYPYDNDPDLETIYLMSRNSYIAINANGIVTINIAAYHKQRVGFFYR